MYAITFTNQAKGITATSDAIGAALPAAVEDAYQRAQRVTQAATEIHAPESALVAAVTAALDAGRDSASDPDVQRAFMAAQLANRGIVQGVEAIVGGEMVAVFRGHADAIVHTWDKPFTRAATTLAKCYQRIGSIPLEDTATIMAKGADIASVWAKPPMPSEPSTRSLGGGSTWPSSPAGRPSIAGTPYCGSPTCPTRSESAWSSRRTPTPGTCSALDSH